MAGFRLCRSGYGFSHSGCRLFHRPLCSANYCYNFGVLNESCYATMLWAFASYPMLPRLVVT